MNKKELSNKNNLFIVGSARGVKRFYIVNQIMQQFPKAKVIHTGNLLKKIIRDLGFVDMDSISILNYYRFVEPVFSEIILSHLEHSDVILDTHYYYLLPGLSIKEILKFKGKISKAILILVEQNIEDIFKDNDGEWFSNLKNIEEDVLLNSFSFETYREIFSTFSKVFPLKINLNNIPDLSLKKLFETIKNK